MITGALAAIALALSPGAAIGAEGGASASELGSQLQPLRTADRGEVGTARRAGVTIEGGRALVEVYVSGGLGSAERILERSGMKVAATARNPLPVLEGWLPLDRLGAGARLGATDAILPVMGGGVDVGAVTSQGVAAHNIPAAISALGVDGRGIDVGVISDSIDQVPPDGGIDDSQSSGDLPPDPRVQVLLDDTDPAVTDEGRAMAEIVYDEAPGVDRILFSSGTTAGPIEKAASIDALVANGANVIADDIFYLSEPFFQDGTISQAVDRAKAAGVAYFASAGNRARQSYESTYRNSGGLHDFDPGAPVDTRNCFTANTPTNGFILVALQWDERWGGAQTDLDLRLVTTTGVELASSTTDNIATGLPREIASFENLGPPLQVCVEIRRFAGAATPFMKWIQHDNYHPAPVPEIDTQSNTINPDAASARGSLAVAAVAANDSDLDTPEMFSSRGPSTRFFDAAGNRLATPEVRINPDLAAADRVSTTVPGFSTFLGTSAAAPSAAGIAALLHSANPNATVNEIYAQMTDPANAIDCTLNAAVPDPDCGAGFSLADRAAAGLDRSGAVVSSSLDPAQPNGRRGWYTRDVAVNLSATDAQSPVESSSGCGSATVSTDGVQTFSCSAVSGGGPGTGSVTVKRDATPPKKPKIKGFRKGVPLPPKRKLKCKSKDATSGLATCRIKGYSAKPGKHKLTAIATDKAGLQAKRKLKYSVP